MCTYAGISIHNINTHIIMVCACGALPNLKDTTYLYINVRYTYDILIYAYRRTGVHISKCDYAIYNMCIYNNYISYNICVQRSRRRSLHPLYVNPIDDLL